MRREVHCASVATPTGVSASVTITLPSYCKTGSGSITWCTRSIGDERYGLYRVAGHDLHRRRHVGRLPRSHLDRRDLQRRSLHLQLHGPVDRARSAKLHVDLPVDVKPAKTVELYELIDDIVLRNSTPLVDPSIRGTPQVELARMADPRTCGVVFACDWSVNERGFAL